jgi:hypothetical protein
MTWEKQGEGLHAIEGETVATIERIPWGDAYVLSMENVALNKNYKRICPTVEAAKANAEKEIQSWQ